MGISRIRILSPFVVLFLSLQVIFLLAPHALATTSGGTLYALMTDNFGSPPPTPNSVIEIVDLSTMSLIRTISLGPGSVSSLAVSPGGDRLYVTAPGSSAIRVVDSVSGKSIANIPANGARDEVLSADGGTLYVTAGTTIVAIDTSSFAVTHNMTTGSDTGFGIALSPDGSILGTASTAGGSNPALYLVNTASFTLRARISITGNTMGCGTSPNDVAFTDTGRALLWDNNCHAYYQVDTSSNTQIPSSTVNFATGASSANINNAVFYSTASARAYSLVLSGGSTNNNLTVVNPATATGSAVDQFSGIPFVPALSPDGKSLFVSVIHRFGGGGPDTLDRYDTLSGIFTRGVYTFSLASMSSLDILTLPPVTLGCGQNLNCSIQSNGVLSKVTFGGNTVHFTATGTQGATGYANVTIPKSAVPNINNLMIFVNNSKLPSSSYTITMDSTNYYVYFIFIFHSSYTIDLSLAPSLTTSTPITPLNTLMAALTALSTILYARNRRLMRLQK